MTGLRLRTQKARIKCLREYLWQEPGRGSGGIASERPRSVKDNGFDLVSMQN